MSIDQMIEVLQAKKKGNVIQIKACEVWVDCTGIKFDFQNFEYRVKPEPRRWWIVLASDGDSVFAICENKEKSEKYAPRTVIEVVEVLK